MNTKPQVAYSTGCECNARPEFPITISEAFLADVLKPYHPTAKYLKSAQIDSFGDKSAAVSANEDSGLITASGYFAIPESCYIEDTRHFNAVEFNICFNQLAYVVFGKCIEADILRRLRIENSNPRFTLAEFKRHQLSSMLIVSIESRYYKQMTCDDIRGDLSINRISASQGAYFFFTSMAFSDQEGVKSKGSDLLAFRLSEARTA